MSILYLADGRGILILRSNRPGLSKAPSRSYNLLVDPMTKTCQLEPKPSISDRSWFIVVFFSDEEPSQFPSMPFLLPMASIQSIQMMAGALFFAFQKSSLTFLAPIPTQISLNQAALQAQNGTLASPAHALARVVFPVPDGPQKTIPFLILAPSWLNLLGSFIQSMTYLRAILLDQTPTISENLVLLLFSIVFRLFLREKNQLIQKVITADDSKASIKGVTLSGDTVSNTTLELMSLSNSTFLGNNV